EEIINALTRVDDLRVTARTSSFAFKGRNEDVRDIAAQLGVETVLEGSVRRAGGRVRIAAQLIDAANGYHLFSEVYDRSLDDIFETQDELARTIVDRLKGHLAPVVDAPSATQSTGDAPATTPAPPPAPALIRSHTHDTEAYTEYLRGRFHWNKWTTENARLAIRHMERSAEMDPSCALPFSGLATAYTLLASLGAEPADDAYPRAAAFARHALELESDAGESHLALANVQMYYEWDFEAAEASYLQALELTPGSAEAHHMFSRFLKAVGRLDEAVHYMETAVGMDPLSLPYNHSLAIALQTAGRLDDAESHLQRILGLDPSFTASLQALGWVKFAQGDRGAALKYFEQLPAATDDLYAGIGPRALVYGRLGRAADVEAMAALLERQAREEPRMNLVMTRALIEWGRGDVDAVFKRLHEAVEARLGTVVFLGTSPNWRELHDDPRFRAVVRQVGIPEAGSAA
ncbi:MAG: hypothetical protein HKO98_10100, partial [Gemmatimonadetes bacterium]|nr:hypothetical protein [Gemmatimonadota bacterium]